MRLVACLGNPGTQYAKNRHNAGWLFADYLAAKWQFPPFIADKKLKGDRSEQQIHSEKIILFKPDSFMNRSGEAVGLISRFYKIPISSVLIIYDDKDIALGETRFREKGSAGGHNGMSDIIREFATPEIARIKIGVDTPLRTAFNLDTAAFVLSDFSAAELDELIEEVFPAVEVKIREWIKPLSAQQ